MTTSQAVGAVLGLLQGLKVLQHKLLYVSKAIPALTELVI
jgi:hypothetical protein